MTFSIAVLISGKGSNLRAIVDAIAAGRCGVTVCGVVSDRSTAEGLRLAHSQGIPTRVVRPKDFATRDLWDQALADVTASFDPSLVVLAGFMRLVGGAMIHRFESRLINVHPSLLPAFPGTDAPGQALRAQVRVSGCTVHLVDHGVDTGPIIAQAAVPVAYDDDAERLHQRIQRAEHRLLPGVIDALARGSIVLGPHGGSATQPMRSDEILCSPPLCGREQ